MYIIHFRSLDTRTAQRTTEPNMDKVNAWHSVDCRPCVTHAPATAGDGFTRTYSNVAKCDQSDWNEQQKSSRRLTMETGTGSVVAIEGDFSCRSLQRKRKMSFG